MMAVIELSRMLLPRTGVWCKSRIKHVDINAKVRQSIFSRACNHPFGNTFYTKSVSVVGFGL
jgi:hypothetical protein